MKKLPIVAVKDKFQVVIPLRLREELGIRRGDLLEAKVERGKLTYTPKPSVEGMIPAGGEQRKRFFQQLRNEAPEWLKKVWADSEHDGIGQRQINGEIASVRRARASKAPPPVR